MSEDYLQRRRDLINAGRPLPEKKVYRLNKVSLKKAAKIAAQNASGDGILDQFYEERRKEMVGVCQCGCGEPSQKKDDIYFRYCICHIFPKRLFESVATHQLNWVERKFWATDSSSACHTNMDEKSMSLWVNFADWEDIKAKFRILTPLLTDQERATKLYRTLEELVNKN